MIDIIRQVESKYLPLSHLADKAVILVFGYPDWRKSSEQNAKRG
jgi:hypothetical protein